ncbi:hypothetical protein HGRIS_007175 [Hohenbuehelia grisea]|uniref:Uncharacterized protein n=1 Tax=Hohenbuehelia grisea TaxID=104357 RepID=A0ABR3JBX9_9AGAR
MFTKSFVSTVTLALVALNAASYVAAKPVCAVIFQLICHWPHIPLYSDGELVSGNDLSDSDLNARELATIQLEASNSQLEASNSQLEASNSQLEARAPKKSPGKDSKPNTRPAPHNKPTNPPPQNTLPELLKWVLPALYNPFNREQVLPEPTPEHTPEKREESEIEPMVAREPIYASDPTHSRYIRDLWDGEVRDDWSARRDLEHVAAVVARELAESEDSRLSERDLDDDTLEAREFDDESLEARDFDDESLEARDIDDDTLEARDADDEALEARDIDDESLEARDADDESLEAREFDGPSDLEARELDDVLESRSDGSIDELD